jgi:hypothetical protein
VSPEIFDIYFFIFSFSLETPANVLIPCKNDGDCGSVVNDTTCWRDYCTCPAGYTFSADVTKCLKGFYEIS